MAFNQNIFVTVASGGTLSAPFNIARIGEVSIFAPTVNSAAMFLQTGFQNAAGSLRRAWKEDGTAQWTWLLAAGSASLTMTRVLGGHDWAAIELTQAQSTDTRTFVVSVKGY